MTPKAIATQTDKIPKPVYNAPLARSHKPTILTIPCIKPICIFPSIFIFKALTAGIAWVRRSISIKDAITNAIQPGKVALPKTTQEGKTNEARYKTTALVNQMIVHFILLTPFLPTGRQVSFPV